MKDLRETALQFLKLDLGYFLAAGAIFTTLKLDVTHIAKYLAEVQVICVVYVVLAFYDVCAYGAVTKSWLYAKTKTSSGFFDKVVLCNIGLQPLFHFMFISLLISYWLGYISGGQSLQTRHYAMTWIQKKVNDFIDVKGRVPMSLEELKDWDTGTKAFVAKLKGEPVFLKPIGQKNYQLIFAGKDGEFSTSDDDVYTSEINMLEIYNKVYPKESSVD